MVERPDQPKWPLLSAMLIVAKYWLAIIVFLTLVICIMHLWGTGVPVGRYPEVFMRTLFSLPMVLMFLFVMGVYFVQLWWLLRKHKAENRAAPSDADA